MGSLQLRFAPGMVVALALASVAPGGAVAMADGARDRATLTIDAVAVPTTSPIVIDGNFDEAVWRDAPAIGDFVQREPTEGAAPTERTEARVAYDDQAVYVAVRAFDREPARHHRHAHAARRTLALRLGARRHRLVPRSPLGVRVLGEPGRREGRSLLLQRQRQRRQLGRGVGRAGGARRRRLARRVPHPVLAAPLLRRRRAGRLRRGSRAAARQRDLVVAAARPQRARLRLAVRRGERPAARRLAQAARAAAVHARRGRVDRRRGRRPADRAHQPGRERRPRPEVRRSRRR